VSPPTFLPNDCLRYIENSANVLTKPLPIQKDQEAIKAFFGYTELPTMLPAPRYLQIQYYYDHFYNTKSQRTPFIIKIAQKTLLRQMSNYYKLLPTDSQTFPKNSCFYWDKQKNIAMLYRPRFNYNDDPIDKFHNEYGDSTFINFWKYRNGTRGLVNLKSENKDMYEIHAVDCFLYILFNHSGLYRSVRSVLGLPMGGSGKQTMFILGRKRKVITQGRWKYVLYKNEKITIEKAQRLELKASQKLSNRKLDKDNK
jgi:hypothetical protein